MLSANFGRSQGIRRMLYASSNKNKLPFISSEMWNNLNVSFLSMSASERYVYRFEINNYIMIYTTHVRCKLQPTLPSRFVDEFATVYHYITVLGTLSRD